MILHLVVLAFASGDGGHHHNGNGRHNRNIVSTHSPTYNRGYQHTSNGNAGGTNPTQNALCRHVTVCNVTQKITIIQPERPAPPAPAPVREAAPATIQTLPVAPQSRAQVVRVVRVAREPRAPFMYIGPLGFMLMAPGSVGFGFG